MGLPMKQWAMLMLLLVLINNHRGYCEENVKQSDRSCNFVAINDEVAQDGSMYSLCSNNDIILINIKDSKLDKMPRLFDHYKMLEVLNITDCSIRDFELHPFTNANALTTFVFNGQNVKRLPEHLFIGAYNLAIVNLANASIEVVDERAFDPLTQIKIINLSNNRIRGLRDGTFDTLGMLTSIRLSNNRLEIISNHLFRHNTILDFVYLDGNDLIRIEQYAFYSTTLKILNVSNNTKLDDLSLQADSIRQINKLDISSTNIKKLVVPQTVKEVLASNSSIVHVEGGPKRMNILHQVERMDFCRNKLTSLTQFLPFSNLSVLDVSQNQITKMEYNVFSQLSNLRELNVAFNPIIDKQLNIEVLKDLKNIKLIKISDDQFDNDFAAGPELTKYGIRLQVLLANKSTLPERGPTTTYGPFSDVSTSTTPPTPADTGNIDKLKQICDARYSDMESKLASLNKSVTNIQEKLLITERMLFIVILVVSFCSIYLAMFRGRFTLREKVIVLRQGMIRMWQWVRYMSQGARCMWRWVRCMWQWARCIGRRGKKDEKEELLETPPNSGTERADLTENRSQSGTNTEGSDGTNFPMGNLNVPNDSPPDDVDESTNESQI